MNQEDFILLRPLAARQSGLRSMHHPLDGTPRSGRGVKSDGAVAGFDRRLCGGLIGAAARGPVASSPVLLPACGVVYNRFSVGRCKKKGYLPL